MNKSKQNFFYYWLPALACLSIIAYFSLTPIAIKVKTKIIPFDKLSHMCAYGALSLLWARLGYLYYSNPTYWFSVPLWTTFFCSVFGVGIEITQEYVGRYFEYADMLANTIGCLFGSSAVAAKEKWFPRG